MSVTPMTGDADCSICLQPFNHPVQLPCGHIFCFLCIKGCAFHKRRCPMCRGRFSVHFFSDPKLVSVPGTSGKCDQPDPKVTVASVQCSKSGECSSFANAVDHAAPEYCWFYEGFAGWWQYDERTSEELEGAFIRKLQSCEVSLAGFIYTIDFQSMTQMRKDHSGRKRRIKRDLATCEKKGIAGIRIDSIQENNNTSKVRGTSQPPALVDHNYALPPSQCPQYSSDALQRTLSGTTYPGISDSSSVFARPTPISSLPGPGIAVGQHVSRASARSANPRPHHVCPTPQPAVDQLHPSETVVDCSSPNMRHHRTTRSLRDCDVHSQTNRSQIQNRRSSHSLSRL
ncbi:unnamed protein product [Calicophoron daubneyi]|uniref:E3 ubiquitin-protein ligase n=1 Tax=Calicophoron daubneyi TaxID=300641 RepID=A0AAV2TEY8_CALDB